MSFKIEILYFKYFSLHLLYKIKKKIVPVNEILNNFSKKKKRIIKENLDKNY